MIRVAICEDQIADVKAIVGHLEEYPAKIEYDVYRCGDDLSTHYERTRMDGHYDIIFLDIEMGDSDGILTAHKLREIDSKALVIYVTRHKKYIYDAANTNMFRYLIKPVSKEEFNIALDKAMRMLNKNKGTFEFTYNHKRVRVFTDEIMYCEVRNRKILMHTTDGEYEFYGTLKDVYAKLKPHGCVKVHTAFLVNPYYMMGCETSKVIMKHRVEIPVSRSHIKVAKEAFVNARFSDD